jgi:hypothetical protein
MGVFEKARDNFGCIACLALFTLYPFDIGGITGAQPN